MLVDDRSGWWGKPCLFSFTIGMIAIVFGILIGEAMIDPMRAAKFSGLAATIVALILGFRVFITAIRLREWLVIFTLPVIWIANLSYTANIDSPLVDMSFDVATTLVMFVFYKHVHEHILIKRTHCITPRRRKGDISVCEECTRPCGKEL